MREILTLQTRAKQGKDSDEYGESTEYDGFPMPHRPTDDLGVAFGDGVQELLDIVEYGPVQFSVLRLVAEHLRAEHRHEGQGRCRGDDHNDADDPSELLEHNSGHS